MMQASSNAVPELGKILAEGRKTSTPKGSSDQADKTLARKEADRLIKEAANFEKSKASWQKRMMIGALVIAGISVVLNMVLGVALSVLMPLKTVEPYLLSVDKFGHVSIEQPLSDPELSYGEAQDGYYLRAYVTARESYDWGLAQRNFDTVESFSIEGSSVWNEYAAFVHSPGSPLAVLADRARVVVDVYSDPVFDASTSTAVVRFSKTVVGQDGQPSINIPKTFWIATIRYDYPNPKLKPEARRLNPLGMKISSYKVVQEMGARQ